MARLRISTFNCENLFSRPKLLNLAHREQARRPLEQLASLQALLAKPRYSPTDQKRILQLLSQLRPYIDIDDMRQKLVATKLLRGKARDLVKPEGRADWVGSITLERDPLPTAAQQNTAKVIRAVHADIQCVIEVEDRLTLEHFSQSLLRGRHAFPYNLLIDGNDPRGIDIGLLTRYPIASVKTHIFDTCGVRDKSRVFSRDCLEVEIALPDGRPIFLLLNHFKSQGYGDPAKNDARRKMQAGRVVEILRKYDLKKELVVVAGDFNDTPGSAALARLLRVKNLSDVLAEQFEDVRERWTYCDKSQIDYLLVSKPLAECMTKAGVERRGLFGAERLTRDLVGGGVKAFESVTASTNAASDHAAVWGEFEI